jgi:prevent-host-death family protein
MTTWGATEAKAKFSAVLNKARKEGPQIVRRRDEEYIVSTRIEFQSRMAREEGIDADGKTSGQRLWESLRCPPESGVDDVEFPRMTGHLRKVDF